MFRLLAPDTHDCYFILVHKHSDRVFKRYSGASNLYSLVFLSCANDLLGKTIVYDSIILYHLSNTPLNYRVFVYEKIIQIFSKVEIEINTSSPSVMLA